MKAERFFSGRSLENMGNKWDELGYRLYIYIYINTYIYIYIHVRIHIYIYTYTYTYIYIWCTIYTPIHLSYHKLYYICYVISLGKLFFVFTIFIYYGFEMVVWRWKHVTIILNSHEHGFIDGVWFVWCYMVYVVDLNGIVIRTNTHLNRIKWGYLSIYIYTNNHWGLYLTMVMYWDTRDLQWTWLASEANGE